MPEESLYVLIPLLPAVKHQSESKSSLPNNEEGHTLYINSVKNSGQSGDVM